MTEDTDGTMSASVAIKFMNGNTVEMRQIAPGFQRMILIEPKVSGDEQDMEIEFQVTASMIGDDKQELIETLEFLLEVLKEGEEE